MLKKKIIKTKFIRISGNEIYRVFESYANDRATAAQSYSQKESDNYKSTEEQLETKQIKELYKKFKAGTLPKAPKKKHKTEIEKHKEAHKYYLKCKSVQQKQNRNNKN